MTTSSSFFLNARMNALHALVFLLLCLLDTSNAVTAVGTTPTTTAITPGKVRRRRKSFVSQTSSRGYPPTAYIPVTHHWMTAKRRNQLKLIDAKVGLQKKIAFIPRRIRQEEQRRSSLFSDVTGGYISPYELGEDQPDSPLSSDLSVPSSTKLVIGLNKYSHDTSLCAADAKTGQVLFFLSKERLSRTKHDGGTTSTLMQSCLEALNLPLENVQKVVLNNHHFRVLPIEENQQNVQWQAAMGINDDDGTLGDEYNLLPKAQKHELSHHLAHAYSVAAQAPFDRGLIVIMDGMGETYRAMRHGIARNDATYTTDLSFGEGAFPMVPSDIEKRAEVSLFDWREGESAYVFQKHPEGGGKEGAGGAKISIKPVFKRWIEEKTPPVLYNHGFENMESLGAVYSRASSHIFGHWNVCGKVMGLAPWVVSLKKNSNVLDEGEKGDTAPSLQEDSSSRTMSGSLYMDSGNPKSKEKNTPFQVNVHPMLGQPYFTRADYDFDTSNTTNLPTADATEAVSLASSVQEDLETVAMDYIQWLKESTGESNLCLAGGVALNSVLNGRVSREMGFDQVFIPPYPGDEGIAVGCCAYGLFGNSDLQTSSTTANTEQNNEHNQPTGAPVWTKPLSPYLGPSYDDLDIDDALDRASPWLEIEQVSDEQRLLDMVARQIASGKVVAWYQGRSEAGPRALGHRSILADPRKPTMAKFINTKVKGREAFRPFAPSVLAEEADKWFDDLPTGEPNASPYMSITTSVKPEKRDEIPAVTHVDGSSRLQTVTKEDAPLYYRLISAFFKETGVPMVLNTSFNTLKGEPIVESPRDAIRSFMCSMGGIEMLVMGDNIIRRKKASVPALLGEKKKGGAITGPKKPITAGPFVFETTCSINEKDSEKDSIMMVRVRMPDRPMHNGRENGGWFDLLDEFEAEILGVSDGTVGVEELIQEYHPSDTKEFDQALFQNIINRLTRLFEHSLISW